MTAGTVSLSRGGATHELDKLATEIWQLCDGRRSFQEIAAELARGSDLSGDGQVGDPEAEVSVTVRRFQRLGLLETIEEAALRSAVAFHGPRLQDLQIVDICTGDYFTAVALSDGSQGAAINFNNVIGPHRVSHDYHHHDDLLMRSAQTDGLLFDTFLRQPALDCLGQSVRIAILNALSRDLVTPSHLREHSLGLFDGYLDLTSRLREGDTVTMIGCTGNYSCAEVGRVAALGKIHFSDFQYTEPFKEDIQAFIDECFVLPEKVILSDGKNNEAICREADVVIMIADTICTNTLDELLVWSAGAREVLITGRSYVMDPIHVFLRGATGLTTQRIIHPNFVSFVKDKLRRGELGFTDSLVRCFERMFVVAA